MMGMGGGSEPSTFNKLLNSWGLTFTSTNVLADAVYMTQMGGPGGQPVSDPRVLSMNKDAFNEDVPATGSLHSMLLLDAGTFSGTPADGLTKTSLISSSEKSSLVSPAPPGPDRRPNDVMASFEADGKQYDLALMLTGKFKTAFPDGQPAAEETEEDDAEDEEDEEKKDEEEEAPSEPLKESESENTVVLIGDVDMLDDRTFLREMRIFTGQVVQQMTSTNMVLVQNLLEQMAGNENLIKIRSRTAALRAFTKLQEMDEESDKKYRDQLIKGQDAVDSAQEKLAQLVQSKGDNINVNNLDPETQKAVDETRKIYADAKKELREIKFEQRKDKEALLARVKGANILIMPILVILAGVVLAFIRKSKTAAR